MLVFLTKSHIFKVLLAVGAHDHTYQNALDWISETIKFKEWVICAYVQLICMCPENQGQVGLSLGLASQVYLRHSLTPHSHSIHDGAPETSSFNHPGTQSPVHN